MPGYVAYGMKMNSEIDLGFPQSEDIGDPDLEIRYGSVDFSPVSRYQIGPVEYGPTGNALQIRVPGTGDFSFRRENARGELLVAPRGDIPEQDLGNLIATLLLSFIVHENGSVLTLHGSAIAAQSGALLFLGERGSGKSTLAAALAMRGYPMLCDDTIAVTPDGAVLPGIPTARLTAEAFQLIMGSMERAGSPVDEKYSAPLPRASDSLPITQAFVLNPWEQERISREVFRGARKLEALVPHIQTLEGIDDQLEIFTQLTRLAGFVSVSRLSRPRAGFRIDELCDSVVRALEAPDLGRDQ